MTTPTTPYTGKVLSFRCWDLNLPKEDRTDLIYKIWNNPTDEITQADLKQPDPHDLQLLPVTHAYRYNASFFSGINAPDFIWNVHTNVAECIGHLCGSKWHTDVPANRCICGLYGCYTVAEARSEMEFIHVRRPVWGACLQWGKMQVHRTGVRSQYAQPVLLAISSENQEEVTRYAHAHGLPTCPEEFLETVAREYGQTLPKLWPHLYHSIQNAKGI